jgi:hypothetical protein
MRAKDLATPVLLALIAVTAGCKPNSEDQKNAGPPPGGETPPADKGTKDKNLKADPRPVVAVSAVDLLKENLADQKALNKKYDGKLLEVSGVVELITSDNLEETPLVRLQDAEKKYSYWIWCYGAVKDDQMFNRLSKDQPVRIQGEYREHQFPLGVPLFNCTVVEQGPDPAIAISAVQLTKEFATNAEGTKEKYNKKTLIVDGVVAEVIPTGAGHGGYEILLAGADEKAEMPIRVNATLWCTFSKRLAGIYASIRKGQTLKIKGQTFWSPVIKDKMPLTLYEPRIVE